jgi:hypothetical protein
MNREGLAGRLRALLNGLYRWLALQAAKRWVSLMLIAGIMVMDLSLPWQGWSFTVRAHEDRGRSSHLVRRRLWRVRSLPPRHRDCPNVALVANHQRTCPGFLLVVHGCHRRHRGDTDTGDTDT